MFDLIFPLSAKVKQAEMSTLTMPLIVYIVALVISAIFLTALLGSIPFIGWLFRIIGWIVNVYCVVGLAIAVLKFFAVLK